MAKEKTNITTGPQNLPAGSENTAPDSSSNQDLVSHHVFLLPFKWNKRDNDGQNNLLDTEQFTDLCTSMVKHGWKNEYLTLDQVVNYNEWHYFYDFVRDVLYETEATTKQGQQQFIKHFRFLPAEGGKYKIETPIPKAQRAEDFKYNDGAEALEDKSYKRKTYTLIVDSVIMHLYYTGVGVLSFHLNNYDAVEQGAKEDILYINQYGRRVFPPFLPIPGAMVGQATQFDYSFSNLSEERKYYPQGKEIAYSISLELNEAINWPHGTDQERKIFSENWEPLSKLKGKDFQFQPAGFCAPFLRAFTNEFELHSILDDRMYVVSWYGNDDLSNRIPELVDEADQEITNELDWWYKYVFVDIEDVSIKNKALQLSLQKEATYQRWSGYGTWYGVTDYSLVLLTGSLKHLNKIDISATFLVTHLQTIYYKLAELVLVQRAFVQRFSDEITHVSRLDERQIKQIAKEANTLYRRYIRFVNRIYFREVTAQVQGIELYELLQKQSRLRDTVESLNDEIAELNTYVQQLSEGKRAEQLNQLSILGSIIAGPSLFLTLLGVIGIPGGMAACGPSIYGWVIGVCIVVAFLSMLAFTAYTKGWKTGWVGLISLLLIAGIVAPPWYFRQLPTCQEAALEEAAPLLPLSPLDSLYTPPPIPQFEAEHTEQLE